MSDLGCLDALRIGLGILAAKLVWGLAITALAILVGVGAWLLLGPAPKSRRRP